MSNSVNRFQQQQKPRSWLRCIVTILFSLIGLVLAIILIAAAFLSTKQGQHYAISKIKPYLERQIDAEVSIGSIELMLPFGLRIEQCQIKRKGVLVAAFKTGEADIDPIRLLDGELRIFHFAVKELILDPTWYIRLQETHLFAEDPSKLRLDVAGHLTGKPFEEEFSIQGEVSLTDHNGRLTPVGMTLNAHQSIADVMIHIHDIPFNILNMPYPLPEDVHVEVKASSRINLTQPTFPLTGDFQCFIKGLGNELGKTTIQGAFSLMPDFSWNFHDVSLENSLGVLHGSLAMTEGSLIKEAEFQGMISPGAFVETWIGQPLKGSFDLIGFSKGDSLEIAILSHGVEYRGISLDKLSASMRITPSEPLWPMIIEASSGGESVSLTGRWEWQAPPFKGILEKGEGRAWNIPFHLDKPIAFSTDFSHFNLDPLHLTVADYPIELSLSWDQDKIDASADANVPASLIHLIYPEIQMAGSGVLHASLTGALQDLKGALTLDFANIKLLGPAFEKLPLLQSSLHAEVDREGFRLDGILSGLGPKPVELHGTLPVVIVESFPLFHIDRQRPIQLTLDAEGEIEPLLHLFFTDTETISGKAVLHLSIGGTFESPQIKGIGKITEGSYESFSSGAVFKEIQAEFEAEGSRVELVHFTAIDGKEGIVEGTGHVTLDPSFQLPFECHCLIQNARLVNLDIAKIKASGQIHLIGDIQAGKLSGELTITQAKIAISEELPTQIKTIDVTYINQPEHLKAPPSLGKTWPLNLNLNLIIPSSLGVKGRGLSSKWKGQLALTGTPSTPLLNGELRNIEGEYDFGGRLFTLEQGTIQFAGAPDKKTALYIVASKDIDRMTAEIVLKGSLHKPVVSFHSNPPMTQKEILSYILFGRGISEINTSQGAQLNQSILTLSSSAKKDEGLLSKIRSKIGIDRVDISRSGNDDSNAISLQVGKYISRGILVSVNKSITAESNSIGIEAALSRYFKVKGEISDDAQDSVTIEWKRDY